CKREVRDIDAAVSNLREHLPREMQAGGRRGNGQRLFRKDGLVSLPVLRAVRGAGGASNVRGERNVADPLQKRMLERPIEHNRALPILADFLDRRLDPLLEADDSAPLGPAAWPGQSEPSSTFGIEGLQEKDLQQPSLGVST